MRPDIDNPLADRNSLFGGVLPVLETPFTDDGELDLVSFNQLIDRVTAVPVAGVMFPGFASEFAKLSALERRELSALVIDRTADSCASVISIPDHATRSAVGEAVWAVERGADALNLLPPYFLNPTRDLVIQHLGKVLSAVPDTPVIVQIAPGLTGSSLTPDDVVRLAASHPNLSAVKVEAVPPGRMVSRFRELDPALPCLVGYAGLYLPDSLDRGAAGVQPGCSFVELYQRLWDLHVLGDRGAFDALHTRLIPYLLEWMQSAELIVQVEKVISVRRGLIHSSYCRAPGYVMDSFEMRTIDRFLAEFADELDPSNSSTSTGRT